jgi:hypothetical protein
MEYDADRYEVRVVGSTEHESMARCIAMVAIAQQASLNELDVWWRDKRLPDDFPLYVSEMVTMAKTEEVERFWGKNLQEKTRWMSTHPSDADRIRSAMKENAPGIMTLDAPARVLLDGYEELSKRVSREFYAASLRERMEGTQIVPTEKILADRERASRAMETVERFFQNRNRERLVFLGMPRLEPAADVSALRASLDDARRRMLEPFPEDADAQRALLRSRLGEALRLLHTEEVRSRAAHAGENLDLEGVERKVAFLHSLESMFEKVATLRESFNSLVNELQVYERFQNDPEFVQAVNKMWADCTTALREVSAALELIPYPYEHATENLNCAQYAVPELPQNGEDFPLVPVCQHCLQSVFDLHFRVVADLALAAEQAERLAGYEELPAPERPGEGEENAADPVALAGRREDARHGDEPRGEG